jgi:hypothetical protein
MCPGVSRLGLVQMRRLLIASALPLVRSRDVLVSRGARPAVWDDRLQPVALRSRNRGGRGNRCSCRKVGGVNPVCLQRSVAHQRVLRVPHEAAIIRTGVTVGGDAARGRDAIREFGGIQRRARIAGCILRMGSGTLRRALKCHGGSARTICELHLSERASVRAAARFRAHPKLPKRRPVAKDIPPCGCLRSDSHCHPNGSREGQQD